LQTFASYCRKAKNTSRVRCIQPGSAASKTDIPIGLPSSLVLLQAVEANALKEMVHGERASGSSLSGAKLYENDSSFDPTHALVLLTNERPILPVRAALKGRLRFVSFLADLTGREDLIVATLLPRKDRSSAPHLAVPVSLRF
jgi:hypothetical protein